MFVDASAIIGILASEPEHDQLAEKIDSAQTVLVSPAVVVEAVLGLARLLKSTPQFAERHVRELLVKISAQEIAITSEIGARAIEAHIRFGKGRHKAKLNFGDCFAYACAKVHKVPLLCKGDDFIHTDIELA